MSESEPDTEPVRILVAGDVVREIRVFEGSRQRPSDLAARGTRETTGFGNAVFLHHLIEAAFAKNKKVTVAPGYSRTGLARVPAFPQSHEIWRPFGNPDKRPGERDDVTVWRMAERLGYGGTTSPNANSSNAYVKLPDPGALRAPHDIVVLDDAGFLFRHAPQKRCWPAFITDPNVTPPKTVVLKTISPVTASDLWRDLEKHADRLVVVLDIGDLRREEARITRGASWERTALDIVRELRDNPTLHPLLRCRQLLVRIGLEGAVQISCRKGQIEKARLFFDSRHMESDWAPAQGISGTVFGSTSCLVAGLVHHMIVDKDPATSRSGATAGIAAARYLLQSGFGRVGGSTKARPAPDLKGIGGRLQSKGREGGVFLAEVDIPLDGPKSDRWTIIASNHASATRGSVPLFGVAGRLAIVGPDFLADAPLQRFGEFVTVDRGEIESLRSVRHLMQGYKADRENTKPLSIGVFGPPGAGKSFAVKQIARGVFGDKVPLLEFNLSQFGDASELIGAFHQIRDYAIGNQLPVVFWDEFDSGQFKWLQYLLAPMQDGKFLQGEITHPIGRAVFVFAGGTAWDFQSFGPPETEKEKFDDFKLKKGPDFKSRLSGYLNILGPNQRTLPGSDQPDPDDICFPIRRAFQLRGMLGRKDDQLLDMDRGLLRALLEVGRYRHGSRSLEKVAYLLKTSGDSDTLLRSDLPTSEVVSLHVDLEEIEALCGRDFGFRFHAPRLAPTFHESYRDLCKNKGWKVPYDMDYEHLPDEIKADNVAAAERLTFILGLAPLWLISDPAAGISAKRADEIIRSRIEVLSEAEHDGWMEHKLRNGWRQGTIRNDKARIHNLLVPYRGLSEDEKDKDRKNVSKYPEIVAQAGYGLVDRKPK